jgi:hypothetical protein
VRWKKTQIAIFKATMQWHSIYFSDVRLVLVYGAYVTILITKLEYNIFVIVALIN